MPISQPVLVTQLACCPGLPAERIPNLVPLLLNSPPTGAVPAVQRLQDGFAACLQVGGRRLWGVVGREAFYFRLTTSEVLHLEVRGTMKIRAQWCQVQA